MRAARRIAVVGERDLGKQAHRGIEASLAQFRRDFDGDLAYEWIPSPSITADSAESVLGRVTAIWSPPGSPYESTEGALLAIQHARRRLRPFLGTCGGFQHALMEYAQNVLGREAAHEELVPSAPSPLIVKLTCSLVGSKQKVIAVPKSGFGEMLGAEESIEEFNCNYGVSPDLQNIFEESDLAFVAHDEAGQVRAFRLANHPFFVGTLFQPERRALGDGLHPVVRAFLESA